METSQSYLVIFSGELLAGFELISVKAHLAKLLRADAKKIQTLFSGKQIVIKRTADKTEALKYANALRKAGADIKIKIVKVPDSAPVQASTGNSDLPVNLALKDNQGNIFDAKPSVEKPQLDLSDYQLAENDGTPLVPESPFISADLDLSDYSVAENDGRPLAETPPEVVKVEAPAFTLDQVGASLETLKPEQVLLNPDTSQLSMSALGADLLTAADKPAEPAPQAPDTSKINLQQDV